MPNPSKYPPSLQSAMFGQLLYDSFSRSYSNCPEDWDPDEHRPGKPYVSAWPPVDDFTPDEFMAKLEATWQTLFDRIDTILQSCTPLIAEELATACDNDEAKAFKAAKRLAKRDRIKFVKLDLSGLRNGNGHEIQLDTSVCEEELGGHDLYVRLVADFEPFDVYCDG